MATKEIRFVNGKPQAYVNYTIMPFSSWRALEAFAKYIATNMPSSKVDAANSAFKSFVDEKIIKGDTLSYGLFGKHPRSYEEAMDRNQFLYFEEYKKIKNTVEKKIREELQKSSIIETMKPKLVFNDREIGEFVFDRAAMSLQPQIYFYSPSKKREIDIINESILYEDEKMFLASDKTLVVYAFKVEKENGEIDFVEIKGENSLEEATKKGIIDCTSANKKVYLYKEKKPKVFRGVKIVVGLTAGGFTDWKNDFFTGIAAACCVDILESLGYSVAVEVAVGGGRCGGCYKKLKFNGVYTAGRRFFTFTAKSFDDQLDLEGLLYTLCDPSFHNIKFISLLNYFFKFFDDELDTRANPSSTWHGISDDDMTNPIGMYHKYLDNQKGNKDLIHFYIHQVGSRKAESESQFISAGEKDVIRMVQDLVLTCENKNKQALEKYSTHDFGFNK